MELKLKPYYLIIPHIIKSIFYKMIFIYKKYFKGIRFKIGGSKK